MTRREAHHRMVQPWTPRFYLLLTLLGIVAWSPFIAVLCLAGMLE